MKHSTGHRPKGSSTERLVMDSVERLRRLPDSSRYVNLCILMMRILWKGKEIYPYETFYWAQTEAFFRGAIGDGLGRTVTARPGHCAICELIYEDEQGQESDNGGVLLQE